MVVITGVERGSRAYRAGLEAGDKLLTINGNEIKDVTILTEMSVVVNYTPITGLD